MAENSGIEWTHHTWNPWVGCTKVSPACDHCYAEGWSKRAGRDVWGPHADRQRTKTQGNPIKWNKRLEGTGERERVFVASLADVFDNHKSIEQEWRDEMWRTIRECPNLDFLLLTKRPQNIKRYLPDDWGDGYPNVWLGTTVENQREADRRIAHLLDVPSVVHFLSCEPLLEQIDITKHLWGASSPCEECPKDIDCICGFKLREQIDPWRSLNWVICGGESGLGARPMHPEWARSLKSQCKDAEVPFFFKQWGEWLPGEFGPPPALEWQGRGPIDDANQFPTDMDDNPRWDDGLNYVSEGSHAFFWKAGKKAAGAHLDGVLHREFPADWGRL